MLYLSARNLLFRPGRALLLVLVLAGVLAQILVLEGFLAGSYTQMRDAVLRRGGDVMVAQDGVRNFLATRSVIPQQARARIEAMPGVAAAHPLSALALVYEADGISTPIMLLAYDTAGGPGSLVAGDLPQADRQIVIDLSLARRYGLAPKDVVRLSGFDFTISGIAQGNAALFTPFVFTTFDGLIDFYFASDASDDIAAFPLLNFLSIEVVPGADPSEVAARIGIEVEAVHALLPQDIARNDEALASALIGPVLRLLLGVSYVAGAAVIGMFMYAAIRRRQRSLAMLRALGFPPRRLLVGVVGEAIAAALAAIPAGVAMALGLKMLIERVAPVYLLQVSDPEALVRTAAVAVLVAAAGALAVLPALLRVDPVTALRG